MSQGIYNRVLARYSHFKLGNIIFSYQEQQFCFNKSTVGVCRHTWVDAGGSFHKLEVVLDKCHQNHELILNHFSAAYTIYSEKVK